MHSDMQLCYNYINFTCTNLIAYIAASIGRLILIIPLCLIRIYISSLHIYTYIELFDIN